MPMNHRFQYVTDTEYNPNCESEFTPLYRNIGKYFQKNNSKYMNLVGKMVKNQRDMYIYHSRLDATHAYASDWYQWPTMIRPVSVFRANCTLVPPMTWTSSTIL